MNEMYQAYVGDLKVNKNPYNHCISTIDMYSLYMSKSGMKFTKNISGDTSILKKYSFKTAYFPRSSFNKYSDNLNDYNLKKSEMFLQ